MPPCDVVENMMHNICCSKIRKIWKQIQKIYCFALIIIFDHLDRWHCPTNHNRFYTSILAESARIAKKRFLEWLLNSRCRMLRLYFQFENACGSHKNHLAYWYARLWEFSTHYIMTPKQMIIDVDVNINRPLIFEFKYTENKQMKQGGNKN